jgi:hypothetical protein
MKSKHRITNIEGDTITLDNRKKYKADAFTSSKLMFWSAHFDDVVVEDDVFQKKITNLKREESIKAEELR